MTKRIAVLVAAALCSAVPACSQPTAPAPTTTPPGADGSTGNDVSPEYCARNEDPGCPAGSYVGPDAIPNPNGDGTYVPCEGTICTNPNYGGNTDPPETVDDANTESP